MFGKLCYNIYRLVIYIYMSIYIHEIIKHETIKHETIKHEIIVNTKL